MTRSDIAIVFCIISCVLGSIQFGMSLRDLFIETKNLKNKKGDK